MARQKKSYRVITFYTTTQAMAFEKRCQEIEIPGRIIPVPREISAGCGLAWRILQEEYLVWESQIREQGLPYQDINEVML